MRVLIAVAPLALLAACGSLREPRIRTVEVKVPVRVACTPKDFPEAPAAYADDALSTALDAAAERYRQIAAANEQRKARLALAEPVVAGCR
jgi:hypothetical protein